MDGASAGGVRAREGASRVEESGGLANKGVERISGGRKGEMLRNGSQGYSGGVLKGRGMVREGAQKDGLGGDPPGAAWPPGRRSLHFAKDIAGACFHTRPPTARVGHPPT